MKLKIATILILAFTCSCRKAGSRYRSYDYTEHAQATRVEDDANRDVLDKVKQKDASDIMDYEENSFPNELNQIEEDSLLMVISSPPSQILKRIGYISSYNHKTKNPNWVSWHLTREHTDGPYPRNGVPYCDENGNAYGIGVITPENFRNYFEDREAEEPHQLLSDWAREYNMDHGHMCPAADNKWDKAAMNQSFLLTNMCPQDGVLNGGAWKMLEEKCRVWAIRFGDIYIISGPIYDGSITRTLGKGKIAVPDSFFKVVLCMQGAPKAIGFIYKNDSSKQSIRNNAYSVDKVESITGFDFFSPLPDELEDEIESRSDLSQW